MSILKKLSILFFTLLFTSCTLNEIDKIHGTTNLKVKLELITFNKTNKNDVVKIFGPAVLNKFIDNKWIYFEVRESKNRYGKRKIYKNDYLEIFFNKHGTVDKTDFYDLKSMNKVSFSKNETVTLSKSDTFSENLLSSTRKRMENAKKKFDK